MPTPAETAAAERARLAHELAALRRLPPLTGLLCAGEVVRGWVLLLGQSPPAAHAAVVESTGLLMWDWADRVQELRAAAGAVPVPPAEAAAVRAFGACVAGLCDRRPGPNREASAAVLDALRAGNAEAYYAVYDPHAATQAEERELFDYLRGTFRPLSAAVKAVAATHEPLGVLR